MPRPRRFLLLVSAFLLASALGVTTASAANSGFVGLSADDLYGNAGPYRDSALDAQRTAGVKLLRVAFSWSATEVAPNSHDFINYDRYVREAAERGITMLPVLFDAPDFYSKRPAGGGQRGYYPPRDNADMARWATLLVQRYGPNGTVWQGHPNPQPITAWQIWNEPTLPVYWRPRPSAPQYMQMLRTVGSAIKAVDPQAEIVTAGLPPSFLRGAIRLQKFIGQIYQGGGTSAFDTLAINSYASSAKGLGNLMGQVRGLMNRRGGRSDNIWITELGWCDKGPKHRFCVGAKKQAQNIGSSLKLIKRKRNAWKLRGFVLFSWRDAQPVPKRLDEWGYHTGLLNSKGKKKPAYNAFVRGVRGL